MGSDPDDPVCVSVQCPLGTYFSLEYGECESCWIGSFQDEEGQMECKPCPAGFSSAYLHSRSQAECKGELGSRSHTHTLVFGSHSSLI